MAKIYNILEQNERPAAIQAALELLKSGGVIAFPTDTVYGIAASVFDQDAIERIYEIKGREHEKAIPVLLGDPQQAELVTENISAEARQLMTRFWPGALTLIVEKHAHLPENLSLMPSVGVRMPNYPFVLELIRQSGPLAVTSANFSGQPACGSVEDFPSALQEKIDLILDGGTTSGGIPSTVVDCTQVPARILREGALSRSVLGIK